ncbi:uncharacterized protein MYCGRDRAFT_90212 [Zymoseptoria tritici IPO323]|uniref:Uncharacterized protein n=1 Tax=Zymoseptoria tritici (strain CBS 115943 / IPO323) TaxID=336722 RepID=F9X1J5_ZYMTI|nr:uncharacterized protein MYCGRDRAFT_90212 [Zymoseptoria tritici IPO323]EGP91875.1 hypothetical protein MYCGRDRAFT_90212 [Zymoseptoria tritici IPO323]
MQQAGSILPTGHSVHQRAMLNVDAQPVHVNPLTGDTRGTIPIVVNDNHTKTPTRNMHLSTTTPLMALVAVLFSLATQALSAAVPEPHANIGARAPSPPPPTEECSYPDSCRINPALCCG